MIQGFISNQVTKSADIIKGKRHTCVTCGLYKSCQTPKMKPQGKGGKEILIIGSSPSPQEDRNGKLWLGQYGSMLKQELRNLDIDLKKDCWYMPSILCSSQIHGEHRNPRMPEILACRKNILANIKKLQPQTVILMGWSAVASVIGDTWGKGISPEDFNKWRGYCIPDQKLQTWLCPVFHPNDLERGNYLAGETLFSQDLKRAVETSFTDFPVVDHSENRVKIIESEEKLYKFLKKLNKVKEFAWDLETTGLKPHNTKVHEIACMSVSYKAGKAFVFDTRNLTSRCLKMLSKVLSNEEVKKIAQNIKYEHMWARNIWKTEVQGWQWDTMLATHCLNNQSGVTGLKFQTYVQFGVAGYDDATSHFLKAPDSNSTNKVLEAMKNPMTRKQMLLYCGFDSMYTLMLEKLQRAQMPQEMFEGYKLLHDGALALSNAEQYGMTVDVGYLENKAKETENKVNKLSKELMESKFVKQWKQTYQGKFNLGSDDQLAHMLYNVKKLKPKKTTKSGKGSTDAEALRLLNMPELNSLLEIRKLEKANGTYLQGLAREQIKGIIHPFFNLHKVITYRSSSDSPNFQNIPKRDKEIMNLVRDAIIPRKGHQLVELDFSQLEVSIAAAYHKDPRMLDYLTTGKDMHGDLAAQIFKVKNFDKHDSNHSLLRKAAKNGFVFPQFYGDYYANNAETLCEWVQMPQGRWKESHGAYKGLAAHLIKVGLSTYNKFVDHIKAIETDFWGNRFAVYQKWKDKWVNQYKKKGSAWCYTGFTFNAPLAKNQLINAPVQGAAFHCLLWLFIQVDKIAEKEGWKSRLIGQIHDAIVMDVHPDELQMVLQRVKVLATETLPKKWTWINAPLKIEAEVAPIDQPWSKVEEYEI